MSRFVFTINYVNSINARTISKIKNEKNRWYFTRIELT